jgi:hypothetical protein
MPVTRPAIASAYQQYLGRPINEDEYHWWENRDDFLDPNTGIPGSGEAQAYRSTQPTQVAPPPTSSAGPVAAQPLAPIGGGGKRDQIASAYTQYLGRPINDDEYHWWENRDDFLDPNTGIPGSGEAQDFRKSTPSQAGTFAPIQGFDLGKLSTGGGSAGKYTPAVRTFSQGVGSGLAIGRNNLAPMVTFAQAHGFPQATATDDDHIDFGDGNGPIDVVMADGSLWFQNGADRFAPAPRIGMDSGGSTGGSGGGSRPAFNFDTLQSLGSRFAGPGSPGVFDPSAVQQVGQDPLSLLLNGALASLIGSSQRTLDQGSGISDQNRILANEGARSDYEIARKAQLSNARASLADRNLLSVPGIPQGSEVGAIQRIEEGLAPAYTSAISSRLLDLDALGQQRYKQAGDTLLDAFNSGTNRQQVLSTIAIQTLEQNRLWQQFLAQFGLDRDKAAAEIQQGQGDQLLRLFELYLKQAEIAANGFI